MKAKYDRIGFDYNATRKADPYLAERLLHHLNPSSSGLYLDIGCGTGNYTDYLQKRGVSFIGIDPSEKMLKKARLKNSEIDWQIGTAEELNMPKNSVDGIIACLTIHHWKALNVAMENLSHVLKPNGNLVIFTSTPSQMKKYWLNHYFPRMLLSSMQQMPSYERVKNTMEKANFDIIATEKYFILPGLEDHFLYCGKNNPSLYLNPKIRNGISSFSDLALKEEVNSGLKKLEEDILSREISLIIKKYENNLGDYLFILGKKSAHTAIS